MTSLPELSAAAPAEPGRGRNGGDLVVETLTALGAEVVFGIPGQHALALFDALRRAPLRFVSARTENNAAYAADGYARTSGRPGVLFLSTGPGALLSLAGLQEAYATSVPVVAIVSQIPRSGLGGRRRGHLHQLDDQQASAQNVTKSTRLVLHASAISAEIAAAWQDAITSPAGPVWVEIPQDVLLETTQLPPVVDVTVEPRLPASRSELLDAAADLLRSSTAPVILAGGGVRRAGAERELRSLAEALRAPVVSTAAGKGSLPWDHPLSAQCWVEDAHTTRLLAGADVLLVVGSSLGEVTSNYFTLQPQGRVIQIDAEVRVLESNGSALGISADARSALTGLLQRVEPRPADGRAEQVVAKLLGRVRARLDRQGLGAERQLLESVRSAVPDDADTFWDMTIAAYWAWSAWDARAGEFHSAQGSGGLGWALGAAIGGAAASGRRVLAVSGDGGAMYSLGELAVVRQHALPVTWLIIDDGGYGILREYMTDTFGQATASELMRPDFAAVAKAFGVPARTVPPDEVAAALREGWVAAGPNVVVVPTRLGMFAATNAAEPDRE